MLSAPEDCRVTSAPTACLAQITPASRCVSASATGTARRHNRHKRIKMRLPQPVKRRSAFVDSGRSPGAESAVGSRYERLREIPTPALRATPTRTFDLGSRGDDRRRAMDGKRSGIAGGQIEMSERPFRRIVVGQGDETRSSGLRYGDLPRRKGEPDAARLEIGVLA